MSDETSTEASTDTNIAPLTPARAAARKRPADRKPKQTPAKQPQGTQRPSGRATEIDLSVDRDAVDIGFDFRAIPVRMGPGDEHLWMFTPDPGVDQWHAIEQAVDGFSGKEAEDITMEEAAAGVERIRVAISDLLADEDDKPAFMAERRYGPMSLVRLAKSLMEEVTGFPTKR